MRNLTETAYYTRRAINWAILAVIMYVILRTTWTILVAVWLAVFPPQAPPPNYKFGKLPAIKFPQEASMSAQFTYNLETIEGKVPNASSSGVVYFMPKTPANLLALSRTQEFAKRLGLDPKPIQESKNLYRFDDPIAPLRRLRFDIVSGNFILRYGFEQDTGFFTEHNFPSVEAAIAEAKSLMQTYNLYVPDIAKGANKTTFLKLVGDKLVKTTSLSQADAMRLDFFRQNVGSMKVFAPNPDEGPVSFVYSGSRNAKKKILQLAYTFWPIDYQTTGTYALKPSTQAWEELGQGNGYIARAPTNDSTTVVVRQVYLGYYDSFDPQTYLQPIYVFEGDYGFMAFVGAVTGEWTEAP